MEAHDLGKPIDDPKLADRTALMTRAHKRDVDKDALRQDWSREAAELGFSADNLVEITSAREADRRWMQDYGDAFIDRDDGAYRDLVATASAAWATAHLGEREAVFSQASLLAATLGQNPGAVTVDSAEQAIGAIQRNAHLHAATGLGHGKHWTTDAALAKESETIGLDAGRPGQEQARHENAGSRRRGFTAGGSTRDRRRRSRSSSPPRTGWSACRAMPAPARPRCSTGCAPWPRSRATT